MAQCTTRWFLSLQITLYLFLIFVQGNEDAEDAYKSGMNLVLEYFLPINLPAVSEPLRREKRDVEGSGDDESAFSELKEKDVVDNSTEKEFARLFLGKEPVINTTTLEEGSGEVGGENSDERPSAVLVIDDSEVLTTTEHVSTEILTSTEMIFDRSEDFDEAGGDTTIATERTTTRNVETTTEDVHTTTTDEETTIRTTESIIVPVVFHQNIPDDTTTNPPATELVESTRTDTETTTAVPIVIPQEVPTVIDKTTSRQWFTTPKFTEPKTFPNPTEGLPTPEQTPPAVEEIFKEVRIDEKLEAWPGNILQKENLSLGADPLLITNTRLIDSGDAGDPNSGEPKQMGAYIVIGLILLSFSSLVGYIAFRKRMNRKKHEVESHQESNDTEKALLGLSDYKDGGELEENHLKNNEITPIVVKSNSQMNKFEKNTNFSSPKNLNTIANEKNIEKDNVLKSTAENLTQVIIEDSPKEVEENVPSMEKLIVKTRIDQDSIPKKPIIINRSSTGYMPIPQDNS